MVNEHWFSEIRLFLSHNPVEVHAAAAIHSRRGQSAYPEGLPRMWQKADLHLPFSMTGSLTKNWDAAFETSPFPVAIRTLNFNPLFARS